MRVRQPQQLPSKPRYPRTQAPSLPHCPTDSLPPALSLSPSPHPATHSLSGERLGVRVPIRPCAESRLPKTSRLEVGFPILWYKFVNLRLVKPIGADIGTRQRRGHARPPAATAPPQTPVSTGKGRAVSLVTSRRVDRKLISLFVAQICQLAISQTNWCRDRYPSTPWSCASASRNSSPANPGIHG